MKWILSALLLVLTMSVCAQAQSDYFPVGPWAVAHFLDTVNVKANWAGERQNLMELGVTYIEGWCEPQDTLWMKNVCVPSNGQIKICTSTVPGRPKSSPFTNVIGNGGNSWSTTGNLPVGWQDTLKAMLDTIAKTHALNNGWSGNFLSHENRGGWTSSNWNIYYTATKYAAEYWRKLVDSLGLPAYLRDRSTNIMPLPYLGASNMAEYAANMNSYVGIVENDCYIIGANLSTTYAINSTDFMAFQNALDAFTLSADSCFKYFENPVSKGSGNTKWHSMFQTCRYDTRVYSGGQWVWQPALRWPTKEEVMVQAWLALSRGAKGIKYFLYFSSPPNHPASVYSERFGGLVDHNRVPRSVNSPPPYNNPLYNDSAAYRIYDWVKEINSTVNTLAPVLVNLTGHYAFGVNHEPGIAPVLPTMSPIYRLKIKSVEAVAAAYHERDFFEVGMFDNASGEDYFMLVNRYCQPQDTVQVRVKLNYTPLYAGMNYFIVDGVNTFFS